MRKKKNWKKLKKFWFKNSNMSDVILRLMILWHIAYSGNNRLNMLVWFFSLMSLHFTPGSLRSLPLPRIPKGTLARHDRGGDLRSLGSLHYVLSNIKIYYTKNMGSLVIIFRLMKPSITGMFFIPFISFFIEFNTFVPIIVKEIIL